MAAAAASLMMGGISLRGTPVSMGPARVGVLGKARVSESQWSAMRVGAAVARGAGPLSTVRAARPCSREDSGQHLQPGSHSAAASGQRRDSYHAGAGAWLAAPPLNRTAVRRASARAYSPGDGHLCMGRVGGWDICEARPPLRAAGRVGPVAPESRPTNTSPSHAGPVRPGGDQRGAEGRSPRPVHHLGQGGRCVGQPESDHHPRKSQAASGPQTRCPSGFVATARAWRARGSWKQR